MISGPVHMTITSLWSSLPGHYSKLAQRTRKKTNKNKTNSYGVVQHGTFLATCEYDFKKKKRKKKEQILRT
jgi:hypothetical protein